MRSELRRLAKRMLQAEAAEKQTAAELRALDVVIGDCAVITFANANEPLEVGAQRDAVFSKWHDALSAHRSARHAFDQALAKLRATAIAEAKEEVARG